ncbi:MAG: hypothetical protein ACFCUX_08325 [Candidatus Methylacidiphilales bacterium]
MKSLSFSNIGFYALSLTMASVYGLLLLLPFNESIQLFMMRKFHLSSPEVWSWRMGQCIPSMYQFENTVEVLEGNFPGGMFNDRKLLRVNHYPSRLLTFYPLHRLEEPLRVRLRSDYRRNRLDTEVWVIRGEDKVSVQHVSSVYYPLE